MGCYPGTTDWSCHPDIEAEKSENPEKVMLSEELAWRTLASLTAYQIGVCPIVVRPCVPGGYTGSYMSAAGYMGGSFTPHYIDGGWFNSSCGRCSGGCECSVLSEIILPGPVGAIVEIRIDGAVLDPGAYRVDNSNHLTRHDGQPWPKTQDLGLPEGQPGTWTVVYYRGAAPDAMTNYAAGVLAAEFLKACKGSKSCRLPSGVTSITRQGVSFEIQGDMFENGMTGIREVDAIIRLYNPNALKSAPVVMSPDSRRTRMTTLGATRPAGGGYGAGGYGE